MTKSMRISTWGGSFAVLMALSVGSVMADEPVPAPTGTVPAQAEVRGKGAHHPCHELRKVAVAACEAQKYVKGGHKNKMGLYEDCVKPILEGKGAPAGVSVGQALVDACQAKKAAAKK